MARIPPVTLEDAPPDIAAAWRDVEASHGVVTNMKATLLHSPTALKAVLEWYALFDRVKPALGKRLAVLFCHAISLENSCVLCSTFMRREIANGGENPDHLELDDREEAVVAFGRQLAADPNRVPDDLFRRLQRYFKPAEIVDLTVFGALMIVNNVVNSALEIDVDQSLAPHRFDPERVFSGPSPFVAACSKESQI
jgi:alkylhydroperoxidase family enzyme